MEMVKANHIALLREIQKKVLWLAVQMVHYANTAGKSASGVKAGGHQSSSASVVTIMTALFFDYLRTGDKVSVKPHASPVFHAIQFLLGNLEAKYLKTLRQLGGLQAYPSRTKDPDPVDFSTGSVGLGATAPNFAALVNSYLRTHPFGSGGGKSAGRRFISLVGDAELDEGSVWEAVAEPAMSDLNDLLWIVDLNRQSLDRVIPGIRVRCWREMFAANGWKVIDVKYGKLLKSAFEEPNGELLRACIDELSNDAYQSLLRLGPEDLRTWLPRKSRFPRDLSRFLDRYGDAELRELFWNLGGHDLEELLAAFSAVDAYRGPSVLFAYTMKGWQLPSAGHPHNHSVLLTEAQMEELRAQLGIDKEQEWSGFPPESEAGRFCAETAARLKAKESPRTKPELPPLGHSLSGKHRGKRSTQQTFGVILTALSRKHPEIAKRVVTLSPDVASSTNLGGWINKMEVWRQDERESLPEAPEEGVLRWKETPRGQHIELGISENNLFMALGQFGLSEELFGKTLFPIGTLYDPFVRRGLDAFFYSIYSGSRFITVGTPSGITLCGEGGAHQSILAPSIGLEMPQLSAYEPCFGQELEWIMMDALEQIRVRGRSTYLRLTTKPVDQGLLQLPKDPCEIDRLRRQVLQGAYMMVDRSADAGCKPDHKMVNLFACGALVPEAIETSRQLREERIFVNVINVTGPGPLYRHFQCCSDDPSKKDEFLAEILPEGGRDAPIVTLIDGHPHSLAWIGSALGARVIPLGVDKFGQSGSLEDVYREYRIDVPSIVSACKRALTE